MRAVLFLFTIFFLSSCTTETKKEDTVIRPPIKEEKQPELKPVEKPDLWKPFWKNFQTAVAEGNLEELSKFVEFPLRGAEMYNNGKPITKENFAKYFPKIFDKKTKAKIAETDNMSEYSTQKQEVADRFNVPVNKKIRTFIVNYVYDEGKSNQTESSVTFQFVEVAPGLFKLYSLMTAG